MTLAIAAGTCLAAPPERGQRGISRAAGAFAEVSPDHATFLETLKIGRRVLERRHVMMSHSPLERNRGRLERLEAELPSLSGEQALRELEALERAMILSSEVAVGRPYSPNVGASESKRTADFWRDYDETRADIGQAVSNLVRNGVFADCSTELSRMRAWREKSDALQLKSLPVDPLFDQTFNLYREICDERLRLGARINNWRSERDAAVRTAEFRAALLGTPSPDLRRERGAFDSALDGYRRLYNATNVEAAAQCEGKVEAALEVLRAKAFENPSGVLPLRPGHSFSSCGAFGFGGKWQTCLNFNVRNASIFRDRNDDFALFRDLPTEWEVAFEPEGKTFDRFEMLDGSWVHAHRDNIFRSPGGKAPDSHLEVWWSECAPGILFDAKEGTPSVAVSGTLGAPDAVAGVFGGEFRVFEAGNRIPAEELDEGWLLFAWNAGEKPKLPVVAYFGKRPGAVEWTPEGAFRICAADGAAVGKFAVTTLHGAVATPRTEFGAETLAQCRKIAALLANFPVELDEFYAFENPTRLKIWNRVTRRIDLSRAWGFAAPDYAPFVPLYTIRGNLAPCEPVSRDAFATRFGFYRAVDGDTVSYCLPVPDLLERIPLRPVHGEEEYLGLLERTVAEACGDSWQARYRRLRRSGEVMDCAAAFWMVPDKLRRVFDGADNVAQADMMVSGEWGTYGGNLLHMRSRTADYQIDPVSGRGAFMAGWRGNNLGMPIRGDMTLFNCANLYAAYGQGVLFGRWDLMRRHWSRLKELHEAMDFSQTWRGPGVNAFSSGVLVYGDMFGDGFRSQWLMFRAAKIMGDGERSSKALYSATKEAATLASCVSPNVKAFNAAVKNIPQASSPETSIGQLGFGHSGFRTAPWRPYSPDAWNAPFQTVGCLNDHPFYGCLLAFSRADAAEWLADFERALPEWADPRYLFSQQGRTGSFSERFGNACNFIRYKAFSSRDRAAVRALAQKALWPAADDADEDARRRADNWHRLVGVLAHLIAQNDPLWIGDFEDARLVDARYDREARKAEIDLCSDLPATLTLVSMVDPETVALNGGAAAWTKGVFPNTWTVALAPGVNRVSVSLPAFDAADFPYPAGGASPVRLSLAKATPPALAGGDSKLPETYRVGRCDPIDLSAVATAPFGDGDPASGASAEGDWRFPPDDVVRGVPFSFADPALNGGKGMLMLGGGRFRRDLPREVSISVGRRAKRLFFLHGLGWRKGNYFGVNGEASRLNAVLQYTIKFKNAPDVVLTMRDGAEIGGWTVAPGMDSLPPLPHALPGNAYPAIRAGQFGEGAGGYLYCWENDVLAEGVTNQDVQQRSRAEITEIKISSVGSGLPIVLAITTEDE